MSHGGCSLTSTRSLEFTLKAPISGVEPRQIHIGTDPNNMPLEVACVDTPSRPTRETLKKIYADRHGNRMFQLVVLARHGNEAHLFGPNPESPTLQLSADQAERILQEALNEPTAFAATQRLAQLRQALQTSDDLGVANAGLFANYYLQTGITTRKDWPTRCESSKRFLKLRGRDLIHQLGFTESRATNDAVLLTGTASGQRRAVAILLNEDEQFDAHSHRFNLTPIAYGLSVAAKSEVPWLVVLRGSQIRLYPAKDGVGVGQRSQADTYFELDLSVVPDSQVGLLDLVFSATALEAGGTVDELLKGSTRFATDLGSRLRARIYEHVVPELSKGVADQLPSLGLELTAENLTLAYRLTLRILFRLLFQAYAEDKGLLPYERNERFTANALKTLVLRDLIPNSEGIFDPHSTALWDDLAQVWKVIDGGDSAWNIPAYNGGLFGRDADRHPEGALIARLAVPNNVMGPALKHMLVDVTTEGTLGPVDFGSLSVREFGTIYEGLLESSLSLADSDLTLDASGAWVPATEGDTVEAAQGTPYFHNSSGERKATGSYFTPSIIVEHLLDKALEPALADHLAKVKALLDEGKESAAADLFFDFRVADLAMGSAHFLVAAVDRIETAFRNFMVDSPIPKVRAELRRLGEAAREALGSDAEFVGDIDDALLLRRQIARRCIYGIDVNEMAVELARLALWIHTFVPGLPMSSLDHGLVCANSLTGIGTIEEALEALDPKSKGTLFANFLRDSLVEPERLLREVAATDEANRQEIKMAREKAAEAKLAAEPTRHMFDAAVAARLKIVPASTFFTAEQVIEAGQLPEVVGQMEVLQPAHLPYLFPEVFLRENPGFDVLLGNPPWEEITVEENKFWRRFSAIPASFSFTAEKIGELRAARPDLAHAYDHELETASNLRRAILAAPFPGMGTGDPDLYKGFAWRNVLSCRNDGQVGIVLPLSAWNAQGSGAWRDSLVSRAHTEIDMFRNDEGWLFSNVNHAYRITVGSLRLTGTGSVSVRGEFHSKVDFEKGRNTPTPLLDLRLLKAKDPDVCIPAVSSQHEFDLWTHLLTFDGLSDGRLSARTDFRCAPATDIHATIEGKNGGVFTDNPNDQPIYNHRNVGHLRFDFAAGAFNFGVVQRELDRQQAKRVRTYSRSDSAMSLRSATWAQDPMTHPIVHPRIVFRDVVHSTNPRKAWFALAPAHVLLTNKAPYLVFSDDGVEVQAYVLGILQSPIVDWFAHLRVNLNLNFFILYSLPVPTYKKTKSTDRISSLAARLAIQDVGNYGSWTQFGPPINDEDERDEAFAELTALTSLAFNLTPEQLGVVLDGTNPTRPTFDRVAPHLERWTNQA
jgi:hypothetical protein